MSQRLGRGKASRLAEARQPRLTSYLPQQDPRKARSLGSFILPSSKPRWLNPAARDAGSLHCGRPVPQSQVPVGLLSLAGGRSAAGVK